MSVPPIIVGKVSLEALGGPTELEHGAYALIISPDGEIEVAIPRSLDAGEDNGRSTEATILFALAEKLTNEEWVADLLADYWESNGR